MIDFKKFFEDQKKQGKEVNVKEFTRLLYPSAKTQQSRYQLFLKLRTNKTRMVYEEHISIICHVFGITPNYLFENYSNTYQKIFI